MTLVLLAETFEFFRVFMYIYVMGVAFSCSEYLFSVRESVIRERITGKMCWVDLIHIACDDP